MSLSDEYRRQFAWRPWSRVWSLLPPVEGKVLLDLGCAIGDQTAELAARGARVIGVDGNGELLRVAESRQIPNAEFRWADLRALEDLDVEVDGIWCSFAAAYFPDLSSVLASWQRFIKKGGWIALTEVDDLFGHEPMTPETKAVFDAYARNALEAGHYDFHMGRKLRGQLEQAGFTVANAVTLEDQELSFDGPATPDVVDSWRSRFERMQPLRDTNFAHIRDEFLATLTRPDHRSRATVHCCIARFAKFAD